MAVFGLAGLAEAALAEVMGVMCLGVFLATVCAFLGLVFRWRVAAVVALVSVGVVAYLFSPWEPFATPEAIAEDSDLRDFDGQFRLLSN